MIDVEALIRQVRAGELEAYSQIIRAYERPVWRVIVAMLGNFEDARELMQQAFVDAYLHLDQYQQGRDFEAWIKTIARNLVRQELRRRGRELDRLDVYRQEALARLEKQESTYLDALARCREKLPARHAQAIALRYEEQRPLVEIATMLETTMTAAEKLLSRARLLLKECIQGRIATE